jgi:hypothetical protein
MVNDPERLLDGACDVPRIFVTDHDDPAAVLLADLSGRPDIARLLAELPADGARAAVNWTVVVLTDGSRLARCDVDLTEPEVASVALAHAVDGQIAAAFARGAVWLVDGQRAAIDGQQVTTSDGAPLRPLPLPVEPEAWQRIAEAIAAGQ